MDVPVASAPAAVAAALGNAALSAAQARFCVPFANPVVFDGAPVAAFDGREPVGADMLAVSQVEDDGQERFIQLAEALSGTKRDLLFALHAADYAAVLAAMRRYFVPAETVSVAASGPGSTAPGVADWGRKSLPFAEPATIAGVRYDKIDYRVPSGGDMFRASRRDAVGHQRLLALAVNLSELDLDVFLALAARDYAAVLREMAGFFVPAQPTSKAS